jgi:hypothetical protein
MGRGKEAAEPLKEQAESEQRELQARGNRALRTELNKGSNWDALVAAVQRDVAEFVENFPRAKTQVLRAVLLNPNNLTISTQVQPLLRIEVIRDYGRSGVTVSVSRQRGWEEASGVSPNYGYTPEGFTDGSRVYAPEQFASEIFEHVTDFFGPDAS